MSRYLTFIDNKLLEANFCRSHKFITYILPILYWFIFIAVLYHFTSLHRGVSQQTHTVAYISYDGSHPWCWSVIYILYSRVKNWLAFASSKLIIFSISDIWFTRWTLIFLLGRVMLDASLDYWIKAILFPVIVRQGFWP